MAPLLNLQNHHTWLPDSSIPTLPPSILPQFSFTNFFYFVLETAFSLPPKPNQISACCACCDGCRNALPVSPSYTSQGNLLPGFLPKTGKGVCGGLHCHSECGFDETGSVVGCRENYMGNHRPTGSLGAYKMLYYMDTFWIIIERIEGMRESGKDWESLRGKELAELGESYHRSKIKCMHVCRNWNRNIKS